jgi:hypothetical protein
VHRGGQRLGHRGGRGRQAVRDRVQRFRGRDHQLGEAAEQPARIGADLWPAGGAEAALAAGHGVADEHAVTGRD